MASVAGASSVSPSGESCTAARPVPGTTVAAVTGVLAMVSVPTSAFGGIIRLNLLPAASVRLSEPPFGPILAVTARLASTADVTLMGTPASGDRRAGSVDDQ